ncbi:MAG: response regulator transcription factor [Bacteroidota bacterium]
MISLLLADDHTMFREGLLSLLEHEEDLEVLGEAKEGGEVMRLLAKHEIDVLILDLEMPGMDGFETMKTIRKTGNSVKILVLSSHKKPQFIRNAVQSGANGYLPKDAGKQLLLTTIRQIHQQGNYFPPELAQIIVESLQQPKALSNISTREKEVIQLIADGLTTKEIAEKLHLSKYTIESHRQNILLKLGVKNSMELVRYAIRKGWVS